MGKVKHLLGISGGKDSAALAIYLNDKHPELDLTYYFCDTGKELDETYQLIENIEIYLGKKIAKLEPADAVKSDENPFDHYYKAYRGYLPSSVARWCTKKMKLEPFERFVGDDPVVSYVGIRGDEDREGYISKKQNIQSIFPFRRNIWSEDVIRKVLSNTNREHLMDLYSSYLSGSELDSVSELVSEKLILELKNPLQNKKVIHNKLNSILDKGIAQFNRVTFDYLKDTEYPLAQESDFPLLENEEVLVKKDIFRTLEESGVGVPEYYHEVEYEVDGEKGTYARSRSGCFFCFFQQKIEWVWLHEQHPKRFKEAMEYENEKEGFTWNQNESLKEIIDPKRVEQIKRDHLNKLKANSNNKDSNKLMDILDDGDAGCTACFV
ncbi:phosphoadenosine phosphosulfate reductase family protein [Salibacter halophilus]|uniref:Phosphoadenosine phosphosulfate reductase family protein n=1 Tax=Salibacter halophilus TaxID=1803916 RepID=A0A6N6MA69_9FLAO|nr:phosphoadenosine phosphosulfate reductase family protein [Salibacter halophilus]KAB1065610.1 phosphoadenosine phosphosulfate reductase family protein [Salibacter halophilus]